MHVRHFEMSDKGRQSTLVKSRNITRPIPGLYRTHEDFRVREDLSVVRNPGSTEAGLGLGTRVDVHVMNAAVVGRGRSSRWARGCLTPRLRSRAITRNKQNFYFIYTFWR